MDIVTLVSAFAENLLTLQEKFSKENRFDLLEKEAVELGNSTIAAFLSLTLTEMDEMIRISGIKTELHDPAQNDADADHNSGRCRFLAHHVSETS